jgi:hypothetical protein
MAVWERLRSHFGGDRRSMVESCSICTGREKAQFLNTLFEALPSFCYTIRRLFSLSTYGKNHVYQRPIRNPATTLGPSVNFDDFGQWHYDGEYPDSLGELHLVSNSILSAH